LLVSSGRRSPTEAFRRWRRRKKITAAAIMRRPAKARPMPAAAAGAREVVDVKGEGVAVGWADVVVVGEEVGAGVEEEEGTAERGKFMLEGC
jgi:hypothetical protein